MQGSFTGKEWRKIRKKIKKRYECSNKGALLIFGLVVRMMAGQK